MGYMSNIIFTIFSTNNSPALTPQSPDPQLL
jgi:hypothetical protein